MARQAYRRFAKGKRRPKSGKRVDPTQANAFFMLTPEEMAADEQRELERRAYLQQAADERFCRRLERETKRALMRKGAK